MITFQDFASKIVKPGTLLKPPEHQSFQQVLREANEWIQEHAVRVLNIETILLPSACSDNDAPVYRLHGDYGYAWRQVIRVWYEEEQTKPLA